jgi:hypothetical protein
METQELLKHYKKAFRDIYNFLLKHAEKDEPNWSEVVTEYAGIIEGAKGTEIEKFVASLGLDVFNELERKWRHGAAI